MFFSKGKNKKFHDESNFEELPKIFPLSPKQDLSQTDLTGFEEYRRFLQSAFSEPEIRNILITGNFGVGKSSIIHSVENFWLYKNGIISNWLKQNGIIQSIVKWLIQNRQIRLIADWIKRKFQNHRHGFLYVSLGDYSIKLNNNENSQTADDGSCGKSEGGTKGKPTTENLNTLSVSDDKQKNFLERRLIIQIYARFRHEDLPASGFKMIQEHGIFTKWIFPFICGVMAMLILLLSFHEPIGELLNATLSDFIGAECISNIRSWGHLFLYLISFLFASFVTFAVVKDQLPKLQARSITIKANSLEAKYERTASESYLDQHITELVYCLDQIAKKIHYTVVFEDLDRFDTKTCLEIFTRLREINYLVNLRLSQKGDKPLRFIYVANESILAHLEHSKFFDYIMPVYPRLNQKTAEQIFTENLVKINKDKKLIEASSSFVRFVSPYLSDYRLQYTILNDYSILFRLFQNSNTNKAENVNSAVDILALAIYKNCFPGDFAKIWAGESDVFPRYKPEKFKEKDRILLDCLYPHLPLRILYYVGFKREDIIDLRKTQLRYDIAAALENVDSEVDELLVAMQELCSETMAKLSPMTPLHNGKTDDISVDNLVKMIRYMVDNGYKNWDWLFKSKNIYAIVVISALACVICPDNQDELDTVFLDSLFKLANFDTTKDKCIFEECHEFSEISNRRDLSTLEKKVLIYGTGKNYHGNFTFNGNILLKDCVRE